MSAHEHIDVVVIIADDDLRQLTSMILSRAGFGVESAGSVEYGRSLIDRCAPHVVICGHFLNGSNGVSLLQSLHATNEHSGIYRILLSALSSRELADIALLAMADDYLSTESIHTDLVTRVRVGLRMWSMHNELRNAAIRDGLTRLFNQHHFHNLLETETARARRYGHALSLIMLDIDHFKTVNDTYGHLVGNQVLEDVARTIESCVRDADIVGRTGGEEFGIIVPESLAPEAGRLAERIRKALPKSVSPSVTDPMKITASFGVADTESTASDRAAKLMDLADRALYAAKRAGRNRVRLGSDIVESDEIESAIEHDEVDWLRRRLNVLAARVRDVYVQSVATLLKALDEKDPYAARHSVNVAFYAEQIATALQCSNATRKSVYNAALLHDIGKVGVPDNILLKRTPLTPLEQMVLEQVPQIGTRIVDQMRVLESEIQIIRHQREHYDGSGTPSGLKGDQIPVGARILLVADAFDAMTTDRVYRARKPVTQAIEEIVGRAGTQFDPEIAALLQKLYSDQQADWDERIREAIVISRIPGEEAHKNQVNDLGATVRAMSQHMT